MGDVQRSLASFSQQLSRTENPYKTIWGHRRLSLCWSVSSRGHRISMLQVQEVLVFRKEKGIQRYTVISMQVLRVYLCGGD